MNCISHFAYSVHTFQVILGTNTRNRIHRTPATYSKVSTMDVARVSTPTDNIFLLQPVSNDQGSSVSGRSVQSMGDLPMYCDSNKDKYNLNNNNKSSQLSKPAFFDSHFHNTLSTTSANRRIKKLVEEIDDDLNQVNEEIKAESKRFKYDPKYNHNDCFHKELKPEFKENCKMSFSRNNNNIKDNKNEGFKQQKSKQESKEEESFNWKNDISSDFTTSDDSLSFKNKNKINFGSSTSESSYKTNRKKYKRSNKY